MGARKDEKWRSLEIIKLVSYEIMGDLIVRESRASINCGADEYEGGERR